MSRYKVTQRYASAVAGSLEVGSVVELDDEIAEYVERDSPGTLRPASGKTSPDPDASVAGEQRAPDAAPSDRMSRSRGRRKAR